MSVRSGQSITKTFTTRVFATGVATNADSTPTGTLYVNGTADAATVVVNNIATGFYKAAVTLPTLTVGDVVDLRINATVSSVTDNAVIWTDTKDLATDANGKTPSTIAAGDIATDAIDAASLKADAITEIQSGLATAADLTLVKAKTDQMTFSVANAVDINVVAWLGYVATVDANNYPFIGSVNTKTGYALTSAYDPAKTAAQATTALDNTVWTNTKAGYLDAAVSSASAPTASAVADAVWDEVLSGHATAGTTGAALTAAQSAGDPWSTTVPASYSVGTAGYKFGNLATSQGIASALTNIGTVELIGPMLTGAAHKIVRGSAYLSAISTAPYVLVAKATYDLAEATAEFRMKLDRQTAVIITASIVSYDATYWKVYADLTASNTDDMTPGTGHDQFWVTLSGGAVVCLSQNYLEVIAGIGVA